MTKTEAEMMADAPPVVRTKQELDALVDRMANLFKGDTQFPVWI